MKNINKFSKLTILFTALYLLIGLFMSSSTYSVEFSSRWVPSFRLGDMSTVGLSFVLGMALSVIFGIMSLLKINKTQERGKWLIVLLTLFNTTIFIYCVVVWVKFSY